MMNQNPGSVTILLCQDSNYALDHTMKEIVPFPPQLLWHSGGGPKRLRVLLEGEALLNDASSFTLFEIFLHLVEQLNTGEYHSESGWSVLWSVVKSALKLAGGGCFLCFRSPIWVSAQLQYVQVIL